MADVGKAERITGRQFLSCEGTAEYHWDCGVLALARELAGQH
jgi:hypothetical protein